MAAWSDEQDDILKALYGRGLSAGMIILTGELPGRSRNAIIGRIHRLKLPCRQTEMRARPNTLPIKPSRKQGKVTTAKRKTELRSSVSATKARPFPPTLCLSITPALEAPPGVSLLSLESKHCRWPIWSEGDQHRFCGIDRKVGSSYCDEHHIRAHAARAPIRSKLAPTAPARRRAA